MRFKQLEIGPKELKRSSCIWNNTEVWETEVLYPIKQKSRPIPRLEAWTWFLDIISLQNNKIHLKSTFRLFWVFRAVWDGKNSCGGCLDLGIKCPLKAVLLFLAWSVQLPDVGLVKLGDGKHLWFSTIRGSVFKEKNTSKIDIFS